MPKNVYILSVIAAVFFLGSVTSALCEQRTLTLNVSVTNPSDEELQEIDINTPLPHELKKDDIISSDGLNVKYDPDKSSFFVEGKVTLQPSETTFYKIVVRDVWTIPESEIKNIRSEASAILPKDQSSLIVSLLDKIALHQNNYDKDDVGAYIASYREDRKDMDNINKELSNISSDFKSTKIREKFFALVALLGGVLGIIIILSIAKPYLGNTGVTLKELVTGKRKLFLRLPKNIKVECGLLPLVDVAPSPPAGIVRAKGVSFVSNESYDTYSAVELKIRLPARQESMIFNGFVAWQMKFTEYGKKERYLTGVSFVEADHRDYQDLRDYVAFRK